MPYTIIPPTDDIVVIEADKDCERIVTINNQEVIAMTDIVVYSINGRVCAKLSSGETAAMIPGFYIARSSTRSQKIYLY